MLRLHAAVVHFPIALVLLVLLFELLAVFTRDQCFRKAGLVCLLLAVFGAGAAYFTGLSDAAASKGVPGIAGAVEAHEQAAIAALVTIALLVFVRSLVQARSRDRQAGWTLYLLACAAAALLTVRAAWLGGELVFGHGAGVAPVVRQHQPPK